MSAIIDDKIVAGAKISTDVKEDPLIALTVSIVNTNENKEFPKNDEPRELLPLFNLFLSFFIFSSCH